MERFEQYFGALLDQAPCGIGLFRKGEASAVFYNDTYYRLTGYTKAEYCEIERTDPQRLVYPEDRPYLRKSFTALLQQSQNVSVQYRIVRKDGALVWIQLNATQIELGGETYAYVSFNDITAQKQAEERRRITAERQHIVIGELKTAVVEWNLRDGSFYASPAYEEYAISSQSPRAVLHNQASLDIVHPDDLPALEQFFADCGHKSDRAQAVLRFRLTAGGYRWGRMVGILQRDAAGRPERVLGMLTDIHRDQENAVMMNSLIDAIPGGVAIYKIGQGEKAGQAVEALYSSDGVPRLSGRTMEEYQAWTAGDIFANTVYENDLPRVRAAVVNAVAISGDISVMYRLRHKSGGLVWVQLTAIKIREEDGFAIYYAVFSKPAAEAALYRLLVDHSITAVYVGDKENRTVLYANDAWRELEGVSHTEPLAGRYLFDLIPKSRELFTQSQIDAMPSDHFTEYHITHQSGIYLHLYARQIEWNGVGAYLFYAVDETAEHAERQALQRIVDHVPAGIGIYELAGQSLRRVYLNNSYFSLLGWGKTDHAGFYDGDDIYRDIYPQDVPGLKLQVAAIATGNTRIDYSYRARNAVHGYTWLHLTGNVVEQGGTRRLYCGYVDISAEKEAELQYQKQIDDIDRFDAENLVIKARYDLAQDLTEYRVSKLTAGYIPENCRGYEQSLHASAKGVLLPAQQQQMLAMFDRIHLIHECARGNTQCRMEYPRRMADGMIHWLELNARTFLEPRTGNVVCFLYTYDVTAERVEHEVMDCISGTQYELLALVDLAGNELTMKDLCARTQKKCRLDEPELAQQYAAYVSGLVRQEDQSLLRQPLAKITARLDKSGSFDFSYEEKGPDSIRRKRLWLSYLDEFHETILITRSDVTELYKKEQKQIAALRRAMVDAKKADRAKTEFLSRISHDMRTPLNGILGLTALMRGKQDRASIQADLEQMELSGKYLLNLINDTLDVSKIEKGHLELHPVVCDGRSVFLNTLSLLKPNIAEKKINFTVDAADLPFTTLYLDVGRVEQLVMNIVGNAIKFTPEGGSIQFKMENLVAKPGALLDRITVRDNGVGMSKEFLPHIFEPFTQEYNTATSRYAGTGLGMTISKQIVELMGGTISVKSKKGEGTEFTFTLWLPIATKEQQAQVSGAAVHQTDLSPLRRCRVLLCEDNALNAEIARRLLEKQGVRVDCAENGRLGLELFARSAPGDYNAVLMDIRMPEMDGMEAARRIRALARPDAKNVPIIAMSANAFDEDVRLSLAAGMNAHLGKPIDPQRMYETILDCIQKAEPHLYLQSRSVPPAAGNAPPAAGNAPPAAGNAPPAAGNAPPAAGNAPPAAGNAPPAAGNAPSAAGNAPPAADNKK
jgi:PAS domain S-box-containing protein